MPDNDQAARDLIRLASQNRLQAKDYERLAMAVFGEMIAKDVAKAGAWKHDKSGLAANFAYGDGAQTLAKHKSLEPCWRRLRQDLYSGERDAFVGVQLALLYARDNGFLRNPRWGGERKREVDRLCQQQGIDPNAPPGLRVAPRAGDDPPPRSEPPASYVSPDVRNSLVTALPIHEQLGIADIWIALPDADRTSTNTTLAGLDNAKRIEFLKEMAGDRLFERVDNRDIPPVHGNWLQDFPRELAEVVRALPPRSQAILAGRYQAFARSGSLRLLHTEVNNQMVMSRGRLSGEDVLELVVDHLCPSRDSVGAPLRYEMQLEQKTMSFPAYLQLRERHAPKLAAREREMAVRHARERLAEARARGSGPSLDHAMTQCHQRLRAERWLDNPAVKAAVTKADGTLQTLSGGTSYMVYDDYFVLVDRLPPGVTAEAFVLLLASDLDATVNDTTFRAVNVFTRRASGAPKVGEIVDIDIGGPDNGSVMLTDLQPLYFVYTCINTSWGGEHPEYGSREFGAEKLSDGRVKIYTRAVSSPTNAVIGLAGAMPQQTGWARLMRGIANTITARGGQPTPNSFKNANWKIDKKP
ncbi:MAG: hypothetical protein JKY37_06640 [Nannocystaceae bacterium]|nr:hypothetical protein [Nannocystaceae bacterium]